MSIGLILPKEVLELHFQNRDVVSVHLRKTRVVHSCEEQDANVVWGSNFFEMVSMNGPDQNPCW